MAITDSKKKQLPTSDVIAEAIAEAKKSGGLPKGVTLEAAILSIVKEGTLPNSKVEQIGNTAFISHYGNEGKEVAMRALNCDTARNYIENSVQYVKGLAEQGVTRMTSDFTGTVVLQLFRSIASRPELSHWGMQIVRLKSGGFRAYVVLKGL